MNVNVLSGKLEHQAHGGFVADPALSFGNGQGVDQYLRRVCQRLVIGHVDLWKDNIVAGIDVS